MSGNNGGMVKCMCVCVNCVSIIGGLELKPTIRVTDIILIVQKPPLSYTASKFPIVKTVIMETPSRPQSVILN